MTLWRWSVALVLSLTLGVPLLLPLLQLLERGLFTEVWSDSDRLLSLAGNTALYTFGTLCLALPTGIAASILLVRFDLPGRHVWRFLAVLSLFVPALVVVSAWRVTVGTGGWLPLHLGEPGAGGGLSGMTPAILLNALTSLPAVILLVGQGLTRVEAELEDDALLVVGPWRVLWQVTLPRCRAAVGAAVLWIVVQSVTDSAIPDAVIVRTFTEEINIQFAFGDEAASRALGAALPAIAVLACLLLVAIPRIDRALPPLADVTRAPRRFPLGRWRWPCVLLMLGLIFVLAVVPLASLIWKIGLRDVPGSWSWDEAWRRFGNDWQLYGVRVGTGFLWSALAALVATTLAWLAAWTARDSRLGRAGLLGLTAVAWALPAPVLGIGLKESIALVVRVFPESAAADILYRGPYSPVPGMWAQMLRYFPVAVALVWPAVRMAPRDLVESVRLEGGRPRHELRHVIWPLTARTFLWSVLIVTALNLGEVAVSFRVDTPGAESFAKILLDRMHYGNDPDVAALCLVLLAQLATAVFLVCGLRCALARCCRTWLIGWQARPAAARPHPRAAR